MSEYAEASVNAARLLKEAAGLLRSLAGNGRGPAARVYRDQMNACESAALRLERAEQEQRERVLNEAAAHFMAEAARLDVRSASCTVSGCASAEGAPCRFCEKRSARQATLEDFASDLRALAASPAPTAEPDPAEPRLTKKVLDGLAEMAAVIAGMAVGTAEDAEPEVRAAIRWVRDMERHRAQVAPMAEPDHA